MYTRLLCILFCLPTLPVLGQPNRAQTDTHPQTHSELDSIRAFGEYIQNDIQRAAFYAALQSHVETRKQTCPNVVTQPMSKAQIMAVENSMRMARDEEGRVFALELAIGVHRLTVRQLEGLLRQIQPEDGRRAQLIKTAYPRLIDPENIHRIAYLISKPDERRALLDILRIVPVPSKPSKPGDAQRSTD